MSTCPIYSTVTASAPTSILFVNEQLSLCQTVERYMSKRRYRVVTCRSVEAASAVATREHFDLVIADLSPADENGRTPRERCLDWAAQGAAVIVTTASPTVAAHVRAIPGAAISCLKKPFTLDDLDRAVVRALARDRLAPGGESASAGGPVDQRPGNHDGPPRGGAHQNGRGTPASPARCPVAEQLICRSPVMKHLLSIVGRIALTDSSVLITGATGTGKELVARVIHDQSPRRDAPFVAINCSAIPDTLVEAELFGHQRGTFTGAHETRRGLFESAAGGTLFLDEVDALAPAAQAKILRVLQERCLRRVGGREDIGIDVRFVSATNRDLHAATAEGSFRSDLLFRLCVIPLHLPELCKRQGDIALLAEHFLQRYAARRGQPPPYFSAEAMRALTNYCWPGNVRELENTVEYALAIGVGEELGVGDLPAKVIEAAAQSYGPRQEGVRESMTLMEVEKHHILSTYRLFSGHQIKTAAALGIDRRTLYRKLKQYGALT